MVELTRERGIEAYVGDVQELPFGDGEFDCVVAGWVLYHVVDREQAISRMRARPAAGRALRRARRSTTTT